MQPQVLTDFQPSAEVHSISDLVALRTDPPTDTDADPPTDTDADPPTDTDINPPTDV